MLGGIYRIYSMATEESYYGSTRKFSARFAEHRSSWVRGRGNKKIRNLLDKYGINNFKFEILEQCPKEEFENKEKQYIDRDPKSLNVWILPFSSKGCNLGNDVKGKKFIGTPHTQETKEKQSRIMKKYFLTHEGTWKGKSIPEEVKKKVSLGLKKYFSEHEHPNKGKSMSEESKKKVSESLKSHFAKNGSHSKGKVLSDETKLKISISKKRSIK